MVEGDDTPIETPRLGSLASRIADRREELEKRVDDLLDVPGFEDIFKLQVRPVGSKRQQQILDRAERVHDRALRNQYVNADILIAATVAFHEILPDGSTRIADGVTWKEIATARRPELGPELTHRQALLSVIPDHLVNIFASDYMEWLRGEGVSVNSDLERDF